MSMVNQITRTGTVLAVDGAYVKVRVGCMSACSSCDISDKCRSAEGKTLVVTALVRNGQSLCPGDNVIVRESRGKALASVFMGYGAPLLVLLSVCAIGLACSVKEDLSVFRLTIPKNALNYTINTRIIDLDPLIEDASPNAQNERTYPEG